MKKWILMTAVSGLGFLMACSIDSDEPNYPTFEEQLAIDTEVLEEYFLDNEIEPAVHESGIFYVVTQEGEGESPDLNDLVTVKYEGRLLSGTVFDSNDEGVEFTPNGLIAAWQYIIPDMKVGEKRTIYAQSVYCYWFQRVGSIPPFSNLIFDIELVSFEPVVNP